MSSITIRNLDRRLMVRLRRRAAGNGRSVEAEARDILQLALRGGRKSPGNLATEIRAKFAPLGGCDIPQPLWEPIREPPDFEP
jgi:plasmid stability protein